MHETLRIAYEKGQPVPPELITALQTQASVTRPMATPERDLRRAIVLIAVGLGLARPGLRPVVRPDERRRHRRLHHPAARSPARAPSPA